MGAVRRPPDPQPGSVAALALDNPLSLAHDAYARKNPATLAGQASFPTVQALRF